MTNTRRRRKFDAGLKAKVAIAAIRGLETSAEISSSYGVHSTQVTKWKKKAMEELPGIFAENGKAQRGAAPDDQLISTLYEEIGRLKVELDWVKKKLELYR